jgi:flotillin
VLNGTDGLGQIMTGLVGQGLAVLDALRRSTAAGPPAPASHDGHDGHDGSAAESSPALS